MANDSTGSWLVSGSENCCNYEVSCASFQHESGSDAARDSCSALCIVWEKVSWSMSCEGCCGSSDDGPETNSLHALREKGHLTCSWTWSSLAVFDPDLDWALSNSWSPAALGCRNSSCCMSTGTGETTDGCGGTTPSRPFTCCRKESCMLANSACMSSGASCPDVANVEAVGLGGGPGCDSSSPYLEVERSPVLLGNPSRTWLWVRLYGWRLRKVLGSYVGCWISHTQADVWLKRGLYAGESGRWRHGMGRNLSAGSGR